MKQYTWITLIGFTICVIGEFLRKLAIITAKTSFNHIVSKV